MAVVLMFSLTSHKPKGQYGQHHNWVTLLPYLQEPRYLFLQLGDWDTSHWTIKEYQTQNISIHFMFKLSHLYPFLWKGYYFKRKQCKWTATDSETPCEMTCIAVERKHTHTHTYYKSVQRFSLHQSFTFLQCSFSQHAWLTRVYWRSIY